MIKRVRAILNDVIEVDVPDNATEDDIIKAAKLIIDNECTDKFWGDTIQFTVME